MSGKVSTIITTYQGADNLKRAIDSVMSQTYSNIEVIVVDDNDPNSKERNDTECIISRFYGNTRFPLKYIKHEKNLNGAVARNTGVTMAKGVYLQLLDDDDVLFPDKISESVKIIEEEKTDGVLVSVAVCEKNKVYSVSGAHVSQGLHDKRAEMMVNSEFIGSGSNLFLLTKVYRELGGFDPEFMRMQDLEFMMRFFRKHDVSLLDKVLVIKAKNNRKVTYTGYQKQIEFKRKFWEKYEKDFQDAFTKEQYKSYFNMEYTHLFRIALMNKSKSDLEEAVSNLKKIRELTPQEQLFVKYHSLYVLIHKVTPFVTLVRRIKRMNKSDFTANVKTTESEQKYIDSVMSNQA